MQIRGEGSIQQLDAWYTDRKGEKKKLPRSRCAHWRLFVETDSGSKSRRIKGSYSDAQKALKCFVSELSDKVECADTFAAYAALWTDWRRSCGDFAPGTIANYERDVRAINRMLGEKRLDSITPEDCRTALLDLKHGGSARGRELSGTYLNELHCSLKMILQSACDDGRIASNPMARIKAPKVDTEEKEALTREQLGKFLAKLDELPLDGRTMCCYFMVYLGLRRAEACALYDSDVYGGITHVKRAVKERNGAIADPKSKAGIRNLPNPSQLERKIAEWRGLRKSAGMAAAKTLCCNTQGGTLRPQNLQKWWDANKDSLGCAGMGLHQLRHSNLSMMARHMSPFDLQHWAGWSSIAPARVYIHDDFTALENAVSETFEVSCSTTCPPESKTGQGI